MSKYIAAISLLLASSAAFAAETSPFYAGLDLASTKVEGLDRDHGFGAFAGYRFNARFAIEAGYHRLMDARAYATNHGNLPVDLTMSQASLSVIGTLPIGGGLSAFGRAGHNWIRTEGRGKGFDMTDSDGSALLGLGLAYAFTPALSARIEFQKPAGDVNKAAAGISFAF